LLAGKTSGLVIGVDLDGTPDKYITIDTDEEEIMLHKPTEIVGVFTDRPCKADRYASNNNIFTKSFIFDRSEISDNQIIDAISSLEPNVIITNIHKILSKKLCDIYGNCLINLHYSILPAFKGYIGMVPVQKAFELNCQFVGSTCHKVEELVDNGRIICQGIIQVEDKSYQQIEREVFESGAIVLLTSILLITRPHLTTKQFKYCGITIAPSHGELSNKNENFKEVFEKIRLLLNV
jgi:phosphoribosylglycinamide formyltransferase-1